MSRSSRYLRLFYVSQASQNYSKEDLSELLQKARSNNERDGLTGLLCYKNQCFAQILEGDEQIVLSSFLRISSDPRHRDVSLLSIGLVNNRLFTKWQMGHLGETDLQGTPWDKIISLRAYSEHQAREVMQRWLALLDSPKKKA